MVATSIVLARTSPNTFLIAEYEKRGYNIVVCWCIRTTKEWDNLDKNVYFPEGVRKGCSLMYDIIGRVRFSHLTISLPWHK